LTSTGTQTPTTRTNTATQSATQSATSTEVSVFGQFPWFFKDLTICFLPDPHKHGHDSHSDSKQHADTYADTHRHAFRDEDTDLNKTWLLWYRHYFWIRRKPYYSIQFIQMVRFPHRCKFGSLPTHTALHPFRGMIISSSSSTPPLTASLYEGASKWKNGDGSGCVAANGAYRSPEPSGCGTLSGFATISFSGGRVSVDVSMNKFLTNAGLNVACSTSSQPAGIGQMTVQTGDVCLQEWVLRPRNFPYSPNPKFSLPIPAPRYRQRFLLPARPCST
jgi:hypothetical protein